MVPNPSCPRCVFSAEIQLGKPLCLCVLAPMLTCYKGCPFCGLFGVMFFTFLWFLVLILLFKMVPKCSTEVLSSFPEVLMEKCLLEKILMSDYFCLGIVVGLLAISKMLRNQYYIY